MPEWLNQSIRDPRTYGGIVYLLLALPLGIAEFTFLVTALALGAGLAITLIGIPILIATVFAWRWVAQVERRLIGALTGRVIPDPYRPTPPEGSIWRRLQARLADPATWKDLVFLLLQFPLGALAFIVAAGVLSVGVAALLAPLTFWAIPDGIDVGVTVVDTLPEALVLGVLGAVLLLVGIPALAVLALRRLRRAAARFERRSGPDGSGLRPARCALAHHRGRRRRAPAHRARLA